MHPGRLQLALLSAAACLATGLRVTERGAARAECSTQVLPVDLPKHHGAQADCDELIPRYDMAEWVKEHGWVVPDHPAVFYNTGTHESQVFPSMEAFLDLHGDEEVVALPEYAQSGGHIKNPSAMGKVKASFRELAKVWNDTFVYFSDFKCNATSLCESSSRQFGAPAIFRTSHFQSKNFLVGGPDSGLPFHKHGMTWQGLSMGRKAWYVLPPGSMTEQIHDETGPYLFPVRAYHGIMAKKKVGERPLFCVQHPGDVFYVPDYWWHATMNLDKFQVAYGEKPADKTQQKPTSKTLTRMLAAFPPQPFDSAGYTAALAGGALGVDRPMPYSIQARMLYLQATCAKDAMSPEHGFELPLRKMRALKGSQLMACGAAETVAFAHCHLTRAVANLARREGCSPSEELATAIEEKSQFWLEAAGDASPALVAREVKICHQ